jgi:haloalkane dehalogenase/tRNA(adenine34) deaminase
MRVLAPDLFGFGRSDKPTDEAVYTFDFHRQSLLDFVAHYRLRGATLVCQDWGGLLGLTLPMDLPGAFTRLIVMNTGFGTGDRPLGEGFLAWRAYNNSQPDMDIAGLMRRAVPGISPEEAAAYAAPFPDATYKAGVRRFPNLVPDSPDAGGAALSRRARDWFGSAWDGQSFMAVGMQDPVLGPPAMKALRGQIRGCPEPLELQDAGHFVQEAGAVIVDAALRHFAGAVH